MDTVPSSVTPSFVRACVLELEVEEMVSGEVCTELLGTGVGEETRLVAVETLSQTKQRRKEKLEALRRHYLKNQFRKNWNK